MKYSSCKEIDALIRRLVGKGWSYHRGRKHGKLFAPVGGVRVTVPGSPSDWRAVMNFRRDVRAAKGASRIMNRNHNPGLAPA